MTSRGRRPHPLRWLAAALAPAAAVVGAGWRALGDIASRIGVARLGLDWTAGCVPVDDDAYARELYERVVPNAVIDLGP